MYAAAAPVPAASSCPARDLDEVRAGWQDVELASFDDAVFDDAVLDARAGLRPQQP